MRSLTRSLTWTGIVAVLLLMVGCTSITKVTFNAPPGTVMMVDGKPHHLPGTIELSRPSGSSGSKRHPVSLTATVKSHELRTSGFIDMYGFPSSDMDKIATNTCNLDEEQLLKILDGTTVVFRGQSHSRQPLYDLTLGK